MWWMLSVDHRVMDDALGAQFPGAISEYPGGSDWDVNVGLDLSAL